MQCLTRCEQAGGRGWQACWAVVLGAAGPVPVGAARIAVLLLPHGSPMWVGIGIKLALKPDIPLP